MFPRHEQVNFSRKIQQSGTGFPPDRQQEEDGPPFLGGRCAVF